MIKLNDDFEKLLIADGELKKLNCLDLDISSRVSNNGYTYLDMLPPGNDKYYEMRNDVMEMLEKIINDKIEEECEDDLKSYQFKVEAQLKLRPPIKEDQINYLRDLNTIENDIVNEFKIKRRGGLRNMEEQGIDLDQEQLLPLRPSHCKGPLFYQYWASELFYFKNMFLLGEPIENTMAMHAYKKSKWWNRGLQIDYRSGQHFNPEPISTIDCLRALHAIKRIYFVNEWIVHLQTGRPKDEANTPVPTHLSDLFVYPEDFEMSLQALRNLKFIDHQNNNLVGQRLIGIIVAWVIALKDDRRLRYAADKTLPPLLNNVFCQLNMSEKTEGKPLRSPLSEAARSAKSNIKAELAILLKRHPTAKQIQP